MPLPDIIETLELIATNNPIAIPITVVVPHAEQRKQLCSRIHVDLLQLSARVVGLVKIVDEGVRERLIRE